MLRAFAVIVFLLMPVTVPAAESLHPGLDNLPNVRFRWNRNVIRVAISQSLTTPNPNIKIGTDVSSALAASLSAWEDAANVTFVQTASEKLGVSPSGPAGDGVSLITIAQTPENVLMFDKGISDASARTRVFVDKRGFITEADIVLNPFQQFSNDGTLGSYDLQSVLTHEIGHLLGLDHSPVFGSTMFEGLGKNGAYGLQNFFVRTLSTEDVVAVRSLYGSDAIDCCGRIVGKLSSPRAVKDLQLWIANAKSGSVVAETGVSADGSFQIGGLPAAKYKVLVQNSTTDRFHSLTDEIATVDVPIGRTARVNETVKTRTADFDLRYIGVGGQLGTIAVPLNRGRTYTLYVGGKSLPKKFLVGSDSPYIEVDDDSVKPVDYNDSTSVASVVVHIRPDAPLGDYSLFLQTDDGSRRYLIGGVTVETFEDPLSLFIASEY